jgi:hypothetical protein
MSGASLGGSCGLVSAYIVLPWKDQVKPGAFNMAIGKANGENALARRDACNKPVATRIEEQA